jgi:hypothetical protein
MFLDGVFTDVPCPRCGYEMSIQLVDARLERRLFCPCCKSAVQLVDAGASGHGAMRQVDEALRRLGFKN